MDTKEIIEKCKEYIDIFADTYDYEKLNELLNGNCNLMGNDMPQNKTCVITKEQWDLSTKENLMNILNIANELGYKIEIEIS